jgi:segregation and condensation protein A
VSGYTIQLPVYEGPLDLLLELIERAELDITKVALAQVTGQYLDYLRRVPEHAIPELAAFLVVAARLLQIKSEALLPRPPEREPGEEDPGEALARQLQEYRKIKQAAAHLAEREAARLHTYLRTAPPPRVEAKLNLAGLDLEDLREALIQALEAASPVGETSPDVLPAKVHIRDKIRLIVDSIRRAGRTSFRALLRRATSRLEVIVSFLAMLELVKQRQVLAHQEELFGDIEVVPGSAWDPDQAEELELEFDE